MSGDPHILIVDDDRDIRDLLSKFLVRHGYRASVAANGRDMWTILTDGAIDLVVLDLMMPGDDGLTLCRDLRAAGDLPVIMLTAMGEETDRIVGLEMGADDYVAKPFSPRELLARIKAVLRRARTDGTRVTALANGGDSYLFDGWTLDAGSRELTNPQGMLVPLSTGEYELLLALAQRPRRVLSRDQLLDLSRGRSAIPFDRSIDVQVSRLRKKIEADPRNPAIIKTVRGGGYMLACDVHKREVES